MERNLMLIAETEILNFYRDTDTEELLIQRIGEPEIDGVSEFVENALLEAIENDEILKIHPEFAYDYLEISKEQKAINETNEKF